MLGRLVLLAAAVAGVVWFLRWFARTPAPQVAGVLRRGLVWGGVGLLAIAALSGRLNPLFALAAASVPFALRILNLLQLLPIAQRVLQALGLAGAGAGLGGGQAGSGRTSSIRTEFLEMELDHASGHLEGLVLKGRYRGQRLAQLDLQQLLELLQECQRLDDQSAAVLESYLDREHGPDWAEQAGGHSGARRGTGKGSGPLTKSEALEILGLEASASADEIRVAHRRLIQKYHPDRGGSDYLAAKINEAKRLLLDE